MIPLGGFHELPDVGDGDTHKEVHNDETEDESEEDDGELGSHGEVLIDVLLFNGAQSSSIVLEVREVKGLVVGVVEVFIVDFSQHHHQDRHKRPGEVVDFESRFG